MHPYGNNDHESGVIAYETGADSITVQFRDHGFYKYTNRSAGAAAIRKMKWLAKKGEGLSTFISQHVREGYELKWA